MVRTIAAKCVQYMVIILVISMWLHCWSDSASESKKLADQSPSDNTSASYTGADSVYIVAIIEPYEGLIDGTTAEVTVMVSYYLYSIVSSELHIGFNTEEPFSYVMLAEYKTAIMQGNGTYTFTVPVIPVLWGNDSFKAYVMLYDPITSMPLADDYEYISVYSRKK